MRRSTSLPPIPIMITALVILLALISIFFFTSPSQQAKKVVNEFYQYEQHGRYSSSWELLHPLMQERFSRSNYIQDRAHVFMNHFGVDTFSYSLSGVKKMNNWSMTEEAELLGNVYKITVTQVFNGKYGKFQLVQDVYVGKGEETENWGILWDYNY